MNFLDIENGDIISEAERDARCAECYEDSVDRTGRRCLKCCPWGGEEPDPDNCFRQVLTASHDKQLLNTVFKQIKDKLAANANLQFTSAEAPFAVTLGQLNTALIDIEFDLRKELNDT